MAIACYRRPGAFLPTASYGVKKTISLPQDFDQDQKLKSLTIQFLEDIMCSPSLLPAEYKAASQLLRLITKEEPENSKVDLSVLLAPPTVRPTPRPFRKAVSYSRHFYPFWLILSYNFLPQSSSKENIESLSALEIAEQMTYLDHQIFVSICSE